MSTKEDEASERWVLCLLVSADRAGLQAVTAEGLIKTTLLDQPDGALPICSTISRLADLSDEEQERWCRVLQQEADAW